MAPMDTWHYDGTWIDLGDQNGTYYYKNAVACEAHFHSGKTLPLGLT